MDNRTLTVGMTELSRHFGDYLSRVRFGGKTIIVVKNKAPVAELRALPYESCTLSEFLDIWNGMSCDRSFGDDLAKVNKADQPMVNPWD